MSNSMNLEVFPIVVFYWVLVGSCSLDPWI